MNCFKCKGELIEKNTNYVVDLENTIIIIKGVPTRVCQECGEKYYRDETTQKIEEIVKSLQQLAVEVSIVNYHDRVA